MNLIPIYQYSQTQNNQTWYAYGPDVPDGNPWKNDGIAFFACASSADGAVAVYGFSAPLGSKGQKKYTYSLSDTIPSGWTPLGTCFWAWNSGDNGTQPVIQMNGLSSQWGSFAYLGCYPNFYLPVDTSQYPDANGAPAFYAVPGNAVLSYSQQNLSYETSALPKPVPVSIFQQTLTNNSSGSQLQTTYTFGTSITASFSWNLNLSLSGSITGSVKVGVPLLGSLKITTTVGGAIGGGWQWSSSEEQSLSVPVQVTANPGQSVICTGYIASLTNASCPFQMSFQVSANTNTGAELIQLNTAITTALLAYYNAGLQAVPGTIQVTTSPEGLVQVVANGTFTGTYAVSVDAVLADASPSNAG